MKRIIHFIATAIVLMTACNKTEPAPTPEQYDKYIFFSHSVETRASLIKDKEDLKRKSFGVVGYKYDKSIASWDNTNAADRQAVFYDYNASNQAVPVYNETIKINSEGICSYEPLQGWSNTKKYTFFAYYPIGNKYVTLVNAADGSAYTDGVPAIKYSVNTDDLKDSMVDLMIDPTSHKDLTSTSTGVNNGNVSFKFEHYLSALGIKVKNNSSGTIVITSATITVSGLKYKDLTVNLDTGTISKTSENLADQSLSLTGQTFSSKEDDEIDDKLIFIPQDENITVGVTVEYTRKCTGYPDFNSSVTFTGLTTKLTKGNKHLIVLNFNESTVTVTGEDSGWNPPHNVEDTFN